MFDISKDGVPASDGTASQVSNNVYGFNLNYFTGDYKPINSPVNPFEIFHSHLIQTDIGNILTNRRHGLQPLTELGNLN